MTEGEPQGEGLVPLEKFLAEYPPGSTQDVGFDTELKDAGGGLGLLYFLTPPDIELHCTTESCGQRMFFGYMRQIGPDVDKGRNDVLLRYLCRNCRRETKVFALVMTLPVNHNQAGEVTKVGEYPPFGPPVSSRLITLVRDDRELFFTGRRAESQGMGIGAFAYYRRVVENERSRILDEIIKVAKKTNAGDQVIEGLEAARDETQFTKSMEMVGGGFPQALLIDGNNPMKLLHKALSKGLHAETDEACLESAEDIRAVLTNLAERMSTVLKEESALRKAVSRLTKPKTSGG